MNDILEYHVSVKVSKTTPTLAREEIARSLEEHAEHVRSLPDEVIKRMSGWEQELDPS